MKLTVILGILLVGLSSVVAAASTELSKDDRLVAGLTEATLFERIHPNCPVRWSNAPKATASLNMEILDETGHKVPEVSLPAVFQNAQTDLTDTDLYGTLRNAGFQLTLPGQHASDAEPNIVINIISVPAIHRDGRNTNPLYLINALVERTVTVGGLLSGVRTRMVTETYEAAPVVASSDPSADIQQVRVEVRGLVTRVIAGR